MSAKIKIDVNKDVTSRLPLEPFAEFDKLCVGTLVDVKLEESESKAEANWEYKGMTVPFIRFEFIGYKRDAADKERFMSVILGPVQNTKSGGVDRTMANIESSVIQVWAKIKHLHDQYVGNPNYKAIKSVPEFDPSLGLEERLAQYKAFYLLMVDSFNKGKDGETAIYQPNQMLAIKQVASGNNRSYLAIPDYVGKGIFDLFKVKDGKIDTTLRFYGAETTKLGITAPVNMGGAAANDLPSELSEFVPA